MVIGGTANTSTSIYRGDSFICAAAVHAGVIEDSQGGCGVLRREGEATYFPGHQKNNIMSIPFDSSFPLSFSLRHSGCDYYEINGGILFSVSFLTTILISYMERSSKEHFSMALLVTFLHVALISDPPDEPAISNFKDVLSVASGRILPGAALAMAAYTLCVGKQRRNKSWYSRVIWIIGLWSGAMCNYIEQSFENLFGAELLLILAGFTLITAYFIVNQILQLYEEGRLRRYLVFYGLLLCGISLSYIACSLVQLEIHIHHYLWPLFLLPGASASSGLLSSMYEGILLGISTNGVARWGFGSLVESRGHSRHIEVPSLDAMNVVINATYITFKWTDLDWSGVNIVVNDVLRHQGFTHQGHFSFEWPRNRDRPEYFRFAFFQEDHFRGLSMGGFSRPAVLDIHGKWSTPIAEI